MVLLHAHAALFQEVAQHSLKSYDDQRPLHLVHPPLKVMSVRPFIKLVSGRQQMHLKVFLLLLLD